MHGIAIYELLNSQESVGEKGSTSILFPNLSFHRLLFSIPEFEKRCQT